jgi:comEA protein
MAVKYFDIMRTGCPHYVKKVTLEKSLVEFFRLLNHIIYMKFNDLKRKAFFWIDRLQISRTERISVVALLVLISLLLISNFFISKTYNYSQQKYDAISAEFNKRSQQLREEQKELEAKYNPAPAVSESTSPPDDYDTKSTETKEQIIASTEKININTATNSELQTLDGIGEAYAQRIIEYREANGGFDSIDELVNVKGIGDKRLENIRPFITLDK